MSGSRRELHVTQQTRREKLRIQNSFGINIEQVSSSSHPAVGFNNSLDLVEVRNVRNGGDNNNNNNMLVDDAAAASAFYSSEMITPPPLSATRNMLECQDQLVEPSRLMMPPQYSSLFPQYSSSNLHSSPKQDWRNSSSNPHHQVSDWMVNNYGSSSSIPNINFLASEFNVSATQKQLGEMHYPPSSTSSPPIYHNALQDIFKSASSINPHGSVQMASNSIMHHGIWGSGNSNNNSEHAQYGNLWPLSSDCNNHPHQGLCLSLSSNSQSKPSIEEGSTSDDPQYSKPVGIAVPSSSTASFRNIGPLGPFTGYATILKSSRYLKPCQQLLDEYCCQKSEKSPKWVSRENSANSTSALGGGGGSNSGSGNSSSMLYAPAAAAKENSSCSGDGGGGKSSSSFCGSSSRPECQKNKAKLLYMQEEVGFSLTAPYNSLFYDFTFMSCNMFLSLSGFHCLLGKRPNALKHDLLKNKGATIFFSSKTTLCSKMDLAITSHIWC